MERIRLIKSGKEIMAKIEQPDDDFIDVTEVMDWEYYYKRGNRFYFKNTLGNKKYTLDLDTNNAKLMSKIKRGYVNLYVNAKTR